MSKIIYLLIYLSSAMFAPPGYSNVLSNIKISIVSNKYDYVILEPIWLTVNFKNESNEVDSVDILENVDLLQNLFVKDPRGIKIDYHYVCNDRLPKYIKIPPSGEISFDIEISNGYGNIILSNKVNPGPESYFSEGNYSVQSYFKTSHGIAYSNTIDFTVSKPFDSDSTLFEQILNIYKNHGSIIPDLKKISHELRTFITENPNSIYVEQAFYYYTYAVLIGKELVNKSFVDDCADFLNTYPNSFYCYDILRLSMKPYIKVYGKSNFINYTKTLVEKYPDTKVSEAVKNLSREKKYKKYFK